MPAPSLIPTPLLLIHGWAFNRRVFDPLEEPLVRAGIQPLFWELPGHGREPPTGPEATLEAWAAACLASLPREPLMILGWSLGGLVAMELGRRYPERVRGLILVSTTPRFVSGPDWTAGHDLQVFEDFERDLESHYEKTLRDFLLLHIYNVATARKIMPMLRKALASGGAPSRTGLRAGLEILKASDLREALRRELKPPVALIGGRQDRLVMPEAIEWMAETLGIQAAWLAPAGHVPFLTDPDWFIRQLTSFIDAHPTF